jgi:hypothetical protein
MLIGTSCAFSTRRYAVTTTSLMPVVSVAASPVPGSAARAVVALAARIAATAQ